MVNDLNSSSENSDQNSPKRRRLLRKRQSNTRLNCNENDFGLSSDSDVESEDFQNSAERSDETWLPSQSDFDHAELIENASRNSTMNNDKDQREITNSNENGTDSCGQLQLLCTVSTTANAGDGVVSGPSNVQANGNKKYTAAEMNDLYKLGQLTLGRRNEYSKKKCGPALTSNAWGKYNIVSLNATSELIKDWVQCCTCLRFIPYNGRTTTGLLKHKCPDLSSSSAILDSFLSNVPSNKNGIQFTESDKNIIRNGAEMFIVKDIRPFYALEGDGMRTFLKAAIQIGKRYPTITEADIDKLIPSRRTMSRHVYASAVHSVNEIKTDFRKAINTVGGFSCTTDLYTDQYKSRHYLGITAKVNIFENDTIIQKEFVVHLDEINVPKKTFDKIEDEIVKVFANYDISKDEIYAKITWTTDRGGNIRKALTNCERLNCFGHLLNNIVEHMCEKVSDVKEMVTEAAALVRYFKKAGLANDKKLKSSLKSYCPTRWNTVQYMFDSVNENYDSIYDILSEKDRLLKHRDERLTDKINCLKHEDLNSIATFLSEFTKMSIKIQGEHYETMHFVWPYLNRLQKYLVIQENDSNLVSQMKAKALEYMANGGNDFQPQMSHKIAVFLHPALKVLSNASEDEKNSIIDHMKTLISSTSISSPEAPTAGANNNITLTKTADEIFGDFICVDSNNSASDSFNIFAEIDNYRDFKVAINDMDNFDLTRWWFEARNTFPRLFRIFLRNSAITATATPSERAFSTTGRTLEPRRSSLQPSTVNTLMLARNHYIKTHRIVK